MQCPTRNHVAGISLIFNCLDLKDTYPSANWKKEVRTEAESLPYIYFFKQEGGITWLLAKRQSIQFATFPQFFLYIINYFPQT